MDTSHLALIAAHGLRVNVPNVSTPDPVQVDQRQVALILSSLADHRLVGLFAAMVEDGTLELDDEAFEQFTRTHEMWVSNVLRVERLLLDATQLLWTAGIEYRAFKGAALAHAVYADSSHRLFADVDLLVRPGDLSAAGSLLVDAFDSDPPMPELRPGFDSEFSKSITVRRRGIDVDVHARFVAGPFGFTIPTDEVFDNPDTVIVADSAIPTLSPTAHFVHSCLNAAVGDSPVRLLSLRDTAETAERLTDLSEVSDVTTRWNCVAPVKLAMETAWATLGLPETELSRWAASLDPTRRDRLMMKPYRMAGRSYARPAASLAVIPGWRARARFLRGILRPQASYLSARGWTQTDHARRAIDRLTSR